MLDYRKQSIALCTILKISSANRSFFVLLVPIIYRSLLLIKSLTFNNAFDHNNFFCYKPLLI